MLFSFHARYGQDTYLPESSTVVSPVHGELFQKSSVMFLSKCEVFSSLDDVLGFTMTSWMSYHCTLGWPTLKGQHCFPCLWIMALTGVFWRPNTLEMALKHFPDWQISLTLPPNCSWISLDRGMRFFWSSFTLTDRLYLSEFLIEQVGCGQQTLAFQIMWLISLVMI